MPSSPQDVYARLLSSPRGYPLWTPEPSNELLMERRDGLRIGDVGVVIPDDGGFDVFFNICLPRDHPFHHRYGVPESFRCIDQSELDIRTIPNAENPGRIISSSSVTRIGPTESSSDPPQRDESSALAYRFRLSPSEGALLILPKGAQRYELLNDGLFLEQASRHGAEWYNYAINRRHRTISHDSLYLITGIYKTSSWSVAAFENAMGKKNYTAHFKQIDGDSATPSYSWETTRALDWRVGPYVDYGIPNQAVFIRGFKIALRNGLLGTRWISVEADAPSTRSNPAKWTSIVPSNSRLLDGLARLTRNMGSNVSQTTMHNEGATDPNEESSKSDASGHGEYDGVHVEIQRMPDIPPAFHPSDAINQYMLRKDPSANIAITHDNHWISMLEDGLLTPNELGQEPRLETVLSENYRVVSLEGVLHLERKGDPHGLDESVLYATAGKDLEEAVEQSPPAPAPAPAPVGIRGHLARVTKHPKYYLSDGSVSFLTENVLFRVHKSFFERESAIFRDLFADAAVVDPRSGSDACPFTLDIACDEFEQFLAVWYDREYSYRSQTKDSWVTILRLSSRWEFPKIRELAIRALEALELPPAERVSIYNEHAINSEQLYSSYAELCRSPTVLTVADGRLIPMEILLRILQAREDALCKAVELGRKSPTSASLDDEALREIILKHFNEGLSPRSYGTSRGSGVQALDLKASVPMRLERVLDDTVQSAGGPPSRPNISLRTGSERSPEKKQGREVKNEITVEKAKEDEGKPMKALQDKEREERERQRKARQVRREEKERQEKAKQDKEKEEEGGKREARVEESRLANHPRTLT